MHRSCRNLISRVQISKALQKFISDHKDQSHINLELPIFNLPLVPVLAIIYATGTNEINTPLSSITREMTFSDVTHLLSRTVIGTNVEELNTFLHKNY